MRKVLFATCCVAAACAGGAAPVSSAAGPRAAASVPPPGPEPTAVAVGEPARDAATDAPPDRRVRLSWSVVPGEAPCSFVLRGTLTSQSELGRILAAVDRIEVEAGGACVPHVVFDAASDVRPDPDGPSGPLEATLLPSPGRLGDESDGPPPVFVDVNFDGALDLRVVAQSGMSASFMRYWLYDPTTRRFVPNVALEELVNPYFDTKTRRIRSGGRGGANVYYSYEHEWVGGELVQAWSEEIHQGSTPAGQPLPAGFSQYKIRHQRRGTKQLKVFEGPAR